MAEELGKHAAHVLLAYGVSGALIACLVVASVARAVAAKRLLRKIESGEIDDA